MRFFSLCWLPFLFFFIEAEDNDKIRQQIVQSTIRTITGMSIYGDEDHLMASKFHVTGCRTAGNYDLTRLERYKRLKKIIDDDWRMVFFVRRQGIQRDEFIDDWLNMADDVQENFKKLQLNGPSSLSRLCLTAFCEEFRKGDEETRKRLLLDTLKDIAVIKD